MRGALVPLAVGVVVVAAAALRLPRLDVRPMHCDEAVHAVKFGRLLERGEFIYNPREYHGPSLHYLTLPVAWVCGVHRLPELGEAHLRIVPALVGVSLAAGAWLLRDALGRGAALAAAALTAVSPAMVFYSRYYIQETLLVAFSFAAIVALVRLPWVSRGGSDAHSSTLRSVGWLVALGAAVGMMHASKETCVLALGAMTLAAVLNTPRWWRAGAKRIALGAALVALVAAAVSAVFFSAFGSYPRGVVDSYATYLHYLDRAAGAGSAGRHEYPWYQYAKWLLWWPDGHGGHWTELPVAVLALAGGIGAVVGRPLRGGEVAAARWLAVYTLSLAAVYSALSYKTPWCALGFWHGAILLGGLGAVVLWRAAIGDERAGHSARQRDARVPPTDAPLRAGRSTIGRCGRWLAGAAVAVGVVASLGFLAREAYRASFVAAAEPGNPYVYAHTTPDVPLLADRVERIAAAHPDDRRMHVQVLCPDDDFWPLPWYFRRLERVGYFSGKPAGPPAPLIVMQPSMEPLLVEYLFKDQPPGRRRLYVPVPRDQRDRPWWLRPGVPLVLWARLDLWERIEGETFGEAGDSAAKPAPAG